MARNFSGVVALFALLIFGSSLIGWMRDKGGVPEIIPQFTTGDKAKVIRVIDGDTFVVRFESGQTDTVRILDIDTPEIGGAKCAKERRKGKAASKRARALLLRKTIVLRGHKRDRYDRRLSKVYLLDEQNFGNIMLVEGMAVPWPNQYDWCKR